MTLAVVALRTCCVCGVPAAAELLTVRERMFGMGDAFSYLQCRDCGSLQIAATPADLARFYPAGYYSFGVADVPRGWLTRTLRQLRDRHELFGEGGLLGRWLSRRYPYPELAAIGSVPGLRRDLRVLDVGCGGGALLRALHEHRFTRLLGVDPFVPADLDVAPGVRVLKRGVDELEGEWDLAMFHHSLEHVPEPAETLRHVTSRLAPGGHVLVRIPVLPNAAFERYRERWVGLDAPRHLFVPTLAGLERMARGAGLRLTSVVHDSTALQFWGSERYLHDQPLGSAAHGSPAFSAPQLAAWEREAHALNRAGRGDQAAILLTR